MRTHALIDQLFDSSHRDEALILAQQVCERIDELAKTRDLLMINGLMDHIEERLCAKPSRESVFACSLQLPFSPAVLEHLLPNTKNDQEVYDAIISNLIAHRTWRFSPSTMEDVIKGMAWRDQHEAIIGVLDGILQEGDAQGAGLDLIAFATEFTLERDDDVMQKWVARNEQRLLELDCEGGITVNSFPGEGIGWFDKGVREFGLKMAGRNLQNGSGDDLLNLERIYGRALDVDKNPLNYPDDWAYYLFLTPHPIAQFIEDEKTFSHSNLMRALKNIRDGNRISRLKTNRVYEIAMADVRYGAGKDPAKLLAETLKDYREYGFPLPKPWVNRMLNEVAADIHENIEKFSELLRVAKTHKATIDFSPFEASFKQSLTAWSRKLSFSAGMALLVALKGGYPIPPKFFGTWFKHCSEKWKESQRDQFLQAIPMEVLQASHHLRDRRMGADLGL